MEIKYLVTGTGRNGTVYMARLLTSLGINCSHEAIFSFNGLDTALKVMNGELPLITSYCSSHEINKNDKPIPTWLDNSKVIAESSYLAAPFLDNAIFKNTKIIHSMRNPLKVISSHVKDINFFDDLNNKFKVWINFILRHMPEIKKINNNIERACYYYVHWNRMIEKHAHFRHRVEDQCSEELLKFLSVVDGSKAFKNTTINSWKSRVQDLTLNDIPNGSIKKQLIDISNDYGYNLSSIKML